MWFASGVLGLVVLATAWAEYDTGGPGGWWAVRGAAGVASLVALPWLLRRPVPTALVLALFASFATTVTPMSTLATVHVARYRPFRVALGTALAGACAHGVRGLWLPMAGLPYGWWLVLVVAVHAGLLGWGAWGAARAEVVASLAERARRAEAEQARLVAEARAAERNRIARELHDALAHRLSLLATCAGALEYRPDQSPQRLAETAGVVRGAAHRALEDVREVVTLLHEDESGGAVTAPTPGLANLPELVDEARQVGTVVHLRDRLAADAEAPGQAGRTVYRVVQEALTNARKHAPGRPVTLTIEGAPGDGITVAVVNARSSAGSGLPGAGRGLLGLAERLRLAGGWVRHEADPERFRLRAWLPWPP
ncbi:sensor histidine kinase [Saccharomonospora piscinae]|nr:sensor histidine kinase [Saccharomonospora piscinae]